MSNCENYISEEDIRALKESEQHIEHVASSRNAAGDKALSVTDVIRGESVTNRTLDGLEKLYTDKIESIGYQQMGDYATGINITTRDQIVFYDDSWYMYRGELPHVTVGTTLPDDGGIWSDTNPDGLWVNVGDASLRSELNSWKGSSLIDGGNLTLYKKKGMFGDNGSVNSELEVIRGSDGFWYSYKGNQFPHSYSDTHTDDWVNVGYLKGFPIHSPENFGAIPNDETADCLNAINLAMKTGIVKLTPKAIYHVTDEVIVPSGLSGEWAGATIKAIGTTWVSKKAVVRASTVPIGTPSVDMNVLSNQLRGVRMTGSLNIDANNIVDYCLYARLLVAESEFGSVYCYNANKFGYVLLSCWYFKFDILHSINCAQGFSLGIATEGESGLLDVNAVFLPFVGAWSTIKSKGKGYNPFSDNRDIYTIGCGGLLGKTLSASIGVLCVEHTQGAGLITMNALGWTINSLYCESNSKDYIHNDDEPNISILSSNLNNESHAMSVNSLHLSANDGILIRESSQEILHINSVYRYDNFKTIHSASKRRSMKIENSNYYTLLGQNYTAPPALIVEPLNVDFIRSGLHFSTWDANTQIGSFMGSGTNQNIAINVNKVPTGLIIRIESDDGFEQFNVTSTTTKYTLTKPRTQGNFYNISIGQISSASETVGTVCVRSKKGDWFYW